MTTEAIQEAIRACDFWAGLEYMNLAAAPDPDERRKVFHIESEEDLPWLNQNRSHSLSGTGNRYKVQIAYCGLFSKAAFTFSLRSALGAEPIAMKDLGRGDAAMLLIPLDDTGRVCGELFVSSLAWMMGRLNEHLANGKTSESLSLNGFDEFYEELMTELRRTLVQLQLIHEEDANIKDISQNENVTALKMRDGKISGHTEMRQLSVSDVCELLSIICTRCGWQPPSSLDQYASKNANLLRIKLATMTLHVDKSVDLGALNSMVATDVIRVREQLASKKTVSVGRALSQYLKLTDPPSRIDLRDGAMNGGLGIFIDALAPDRLPMGAWPDFPLVAAQQFAVNMSRSHLVEGGLYGVNGPPGTGKSTLLRDIVADLIVSRAEIMATYADPLKAFTRRGEIEGYKFGFWELDSALRGHGIAVVSSNNGAVENVIKDLPKLTNPMRDAGLRYFTDVSDSIAAGPKDKTRSCGSTWGLVAALLGSSDKRRAFMSRFWFETSPGEGENVDPERLRSLKGIIEKSDHMVVPWEQAVREFNEARHQMQKRAKAIQSRILLAHGIDSLEATISTNSRQIQDFRESINVLANAERLAFKEMNNANHQLNCCLNLILADSALTKGRLQLTQAELNIIKFPSESIANASVRFIEEAFSTATRHTSMVLAAKPGFFEALFNWDAKQSWRKQLLAASENERVAIEELRNARQIAAHATAASDQLKFAKLVYAESEILAKKAADEAYQLGLQRPFDEQAQKQFEVTLELARKKHFQITEQVKSKRDELQTLDASNNALLVRLQELNSQLSRIDKLLGPLDPSFHNSSKLHSKSDQELQLGVPYNDATLRKMRVDVFRLAMQLNESFVVASWKRMSNSLSAFVAYQGGKFSKAHAENAMTHLWNAFFLVVPVVSTTFASFGRLFAGLGKEEIGTLLIDEAGQSTPQNAVGAIWRSRRIIAVGDPLQLEPVVPQPKDAIVPWRDWVGANKKWTPPDCSTQVLADSMTPYGTELDVGSVEDCKVWVGSPLRVLRRCLNPMFDAANEIAYANLMVHGVRDETSVNDWIGPSQWFDVGGEGDGHWVKAQGDFTIKLIKKLLETPELNGELKNEKGEWHINVITPYKDVSTDFKNILRTTFSGFVDIHKMAGTVHTFQGKEADVVILLLGGNPERAGAVSFFAGDEQSPNLLNVALTRAKKRIYVVGDKPLWVNNSGTFRRLNEYLEMNSR